MNLTQNTLPCFVTPIVNYCWDDCVELNDRLAALILAMESRVPSLRRSNVGGWHSDLGFLEYPDPTVANLRDRLQGFVQSLVHQFAKSPATRAESSLRIEGWANVMRQGQYNSVHCHPNALWSMVYYVTGNEASAQYPFSGKLELLDPRPGASVTFDETSSLHGRLLFSPRPGQVLAFPAWLQHQVHPLFSDTPRISIAVNVLQPRD